MKRIILEFENGSIPYQAEKETLGFNAFKARGLQRSAESFIFDQEYHFRCYHL